MSDDRASRIRWRALVACVSGIAMAIGSILIPAMFGEHRGWSDEEAVAYLRAGSRLHDLLEGTHDHEHENLPFESEAAERAFRESLQARERQHVHVEPSELTSARTEFERQKGQLDRIRSRNARQMSVLFWGGVMLGGAGAVAFLAIGYANDD